MQTGKFRVSDLEHHKDTGREVICKIGGPVLQAEQINKDGTILCTWETWDSSTDEKGFAKFSNRKVHSGPFHPSYLVHFRQSDLKPLDVDSLNLPKES